MGIVMIGALGVLLGLTLAVFVLLHVRNLDSGHR